MARAYSACGSWLHPICLYKVAARRVVVTGIRTASRELATQVVATDAEEALSGQREAEGDAALVPQVHALALDLGADDGLAIAAPSQ